MPRFFINAPVTLALFAAAAFVTLTDPFLGIGRGLAAHGPVRLGDLGFYQGLLTYPIPHSGLLHLKGNFVLILLLGPALEERFGSIRLLVMMAVTALVTGFAHVALNPGGGLVGASGIAFMCITLLSISSMRGGRLPMTFALVAGLLLVSELGDLIHEDFAGRGGRVSQTAHILGGVMGALLGYLTKPEKPGSGFTIG